MNADSTQTYVVEYRGDGEIFLPGLPLGEWHFEQCSIVWFIPVIKQYDDEGN